MPAVPIPVVSENTIGSPLTLADFENGSRQRIDTWFRQATQQLYGDAFSAERSGFQTIPNGYVYTMLQFNVVDYKTNNCFSGSSFTASRNGVYQFNAKIQYSDPFADGDVTSLSFNINGLSGYQQIDYRCYANDKPSQMLSALIPLSKGDVIYAEVAQTNASSRDARQTAFSGFLVRPF